MAVNECHRHFYVSRLFLFVRIGFLGASNVEGSDGMLIGQHAVHPGVNPNKEWYGHCCNETDHKPLTRRTSVKDGNE